MATTCYFLVALVGGAVCNPLCQTSICETQNRRNGLLQALGSTTVCEATPNLLGRGYGLGLNLQGAPYLPSYVNGPFCPYGISPGYGSTTVFESVPNVGPGLGVVIGGLGGCSGLSPIIPGSTTVCESTPNLGLGIGGNAYGYGVPYFPNRACQTNMCESIIPNLGLEIECNRYGGACGLGAIVPSSTTVCPCESTPNFVPGLCYGEPCFPNSAGQTTICESITPNLGLGIGCNGCVGTGGLSGIFPDSTTVCPCESTPNFGSGVCCGGPYFPNYAGQTTICESITPNVDLGIGCNGCVGTAGLGAIIPDSTTVCPCESTPNFGSGVCYGGPYFPNNAGQTTPNFWPGLCYGGSYFPNRAGQINICETIPNVSPGYLYGIPRYNNFGLGLGLGYH